MVQFCHYLFPQTASVCFYRGCVVSMHSPVLSLLTPSDSFSMLLQGLCGKCAWPSSPVLSLLSPSDSFSMLLQGLCIKCVWPSSVTTQSLRQASVYFYRGCVVSMHGPVLSRLSPSDSFSMLLQGLCGKCVWSSSVTTQSL